jgi:hypothetical protein
MKHLLLLASLLFSTPSLALSPAEEAHYTPINWLTNPGAERGTGGVSATGVAVTTAAVSTAGGGTGSYVFSWDSSAASQILTFGSKAVTENQSVTCSARFKAATGTATHLLRIYDGTSVLNSTTILSSTTKFMRASVTATSGTSGSVYCQLVSVNANEPKVYADDAYFGLAEGFNWAQTSQASIWGGVEWTAGDNTWQITQTTYASLFSANGTNATAFGNAAAPGTATPAIVANNMTAADYKITFANFAIQSPSGVAAKCQIGDGSGRLAEIVSQRTSSGDTHPLTMTARVSYTTLTSKTYSLACLSASGAVTVQSTTATYILIERFPNSSDLTARSDQAPASWSGYTTVSGGCSVTGTTYADTSACTSIAVTQTTNRNFGTVTTAASSLPGVIITPARAGMKRICAFPLVASTSTSTVSARLMVGSTVVHPGASSQVYGSVANGVVSLPLCGIYSASDTSAFTAKVQLAASTGATNIQNGAASGSGAIQWTIEDADAANGQVIFAPRQVAIGTAQTSDGTLASASFGNPTNQPTVTFTANATAKYRIYASFTTFNSSGGVDCFQVNNSAGGATVNFNQVVCFDGTASGTRTPISIYQVASLTANTAYTFGIQCKTSSAGSCRINSAISANGVALIAEQIE